MQLDIADFVITAYLCPLKSVMFGNNQISSLQRCAESSGVPDSVSPESGDGVVLFYGLECMQP